MVNQDNETCQSIDLEVTICIHRSTVNLTLKKPTYMEQISMSLDCSYAYRSFYNDYLYLYDTITMPHGF